jgi:hypothetical protein
MFYKYTFIREIFNEAQNLPNRVTKSAVRWNVFRTTTQEHLHNCQHQQNRTDIDEQKIEDIDELIEDNEEQE